MIEPSHFLVVAVAAALRPKRRARRMTRGEARRAVRFAHEAWPRIRRALLADVHRVAA
jgi:hypothetical protein